MEYLNEEHDLLKLPKLVSKKIAMSDKITYFMPGELIDEFDFPDEEDAEYDDKYRAPIDPDSDFVPNEISINELLDKDEWYGNFTKVCNNAATKYKEPRPPYIDPDLEDALLAKGTTDDYIFWTNPAPIDGKEIDLANGMIDPGMNDVDIKKTWDNVVLDLALRMFRLKTFTAATQYDRLKHAIAWICIRQAQMLALKEVFANAGIEVTIPDAMSAKVKFNEKMAYLNELNRKSKGGMFVHEDAEIIYWVFDPTFGFNAKGMSKKDLDDIVTKIEKEAFDI